MKLLHVVSMCEEKMALASDPVIPFCDGSAEDTGGSAQKLKVSV